MLNRAMNSERSRTAAPHGERARTAIVEQVTQFLHDDDAADIAAILARGGISAADVVREFGTTQALAGSVAATIADWMLAPLGQPCAASFKCRLTAFAHRATDEYIGLRLRNLYRIAMDEGAADDAIRGELYRHGPERMLIELARFFDAVRDAGVSLHADSPRLASCFLALLRTRWDPLSGGADEFAREGGISGLVDTFLSGLGREANRA